LLTYGFLHSTEDIAHILINMLVLFMFGREVEARYGKREFLLFYLVGIIAAGTGLVAQRVRGQHEQPAI
jgi:membrane associated rhomboid family serine protease